MAAVADPDTGVSAYDTYGNSPNTSPWLVVGGTSVSSPFIAGIFGLAGPSASQDGGRTFWTLNKQQRTKYLFNITRGHNGTCSPTYLCTDGTKEYKDYGGPTGWGTPNGIGAF